MSPSKYVQEAVRNVGIYLEEDFGGQKLAKKVQAPWLMDYVSELNESPELPA